MLSFFSLLENKCYPFVRSSRLEVAYVSSLVVPKKSRPACHELEQELDKKTVANPLLFHRKSVAMRRNLFVSLGIKNPLKVDMSVTAF